MSGPLTPDVFVQWRLPLIPSGTTVYEWAFRPLADENAWREPRLRRLGSITRRLSSDDGDSAVPSCDVELDDSDGLIRSILSDPDCSPHGGEAAVSIVSEAGRKSGKPSSDLCRGVVTSAQPMPGRKAKLRIDGGMGAKFSGADLKKTYPQVRIGDEHPNAPASSIGLVYPLIIGEHSDVDAVDANGDSAEKGLLPAIDVGDVLMLADGTEVDPADAEITYVESPTGLGATVQGTAGTTTHRYTVTALSAYGETRPSTAITVTTAPNLMNGTDRVLLSWTGSTGAIGYRVYRDNQRIGLVNGNGTWLSPATTFTDVGTAGTGPSAPVTNTAQITITVDGEPAYGWTRFVAAAKCVTVSHVYASDLASGVAPKRTRLGADHFGTELLVFGEDGWPHANPYVDIGGIRQTVFYMRGPRVAHHRDGLVTVAWNGGGVEDVGDGSGDMIAQAFAGLQWLLNEEVNRDGGTGYRTGLYGDIETYANGVPMLRTQAFEACQEISKTFMGDTTGYTMALALTEPATLRTILRRFHMTFGSFDATNRFGQFYPVLIDDTAEAAGTERAYRDRESIIAFGGETLVYDKVITKQTYHASWDADAQAWRSPDKVVEYDPADYGFAEHKQRAARECYYTHDLAVAADSVDRYLRRHLRPTRTVSYTTDLTGLEDDLGAEVSLTHYEGAASAAGDVNTRGLIIAHVTDPNAPETVTHTVLDLSRIVAGA